MTRRIVLEIVLTIVATLLLAWLMIGVTTAVSSGGDVAAVFADQAPRALFGFLGVALGLWAVLVVIVSIAFRNRTPRWRIVAHLVSLAIAIAVNIGLLALVAGAAGGAGTDGWGLLVLVGASATGAQLLVAGIIAVLVVQLLILRLKTVPAPAVQPVSPPA